MKKLIYMLDGLRLSKSSANFNLCVKYSFDSYHVCLMLIQIHVLLGQIMVNTYDRHPEETLIQVLF